ncbi:hypothetical protein GCM10022393_43270 [Aquimarina addita]|uniref:Uncharacterized protein n=1 Tax=Aquimarina addita TaxID=870485 RepID=A0ABP6V0A5_9FLAO
MNRYKLLMLLLSLTSFLSCAQDKNDEIICNNKLEKFFIQNLGVISEYQSSIDHTLILFSEIVSQKQTKLDKKYAEQPNKYAKIKIITTN